MSKPRSLSVDLLRLDKQLCFALYSASRAMTAAYRPLLDELGLTYPQYLVMLVLWEHGSATVGGLGTQLRLDSGTLSPLLKRLESQGYITRARSPEDERAVSVTLTPSGRALKGRAEALPVTIACRAKLDAKRLGGLRESLKALIADLDASEAAA